MTGRLRGRVGVVTGAGGGTGREVALALAAEGMHLALLDRTGAQVRALAEQISAEHGLPVLPFAVDVSDAAAVDRVVAHVEQQLGPVDLLVDDAGGAGREPLPSSGAHDAQPSDVVPALSGGASLLCRALLPAMVARRHGHVVELSSGAGAGSGPPVGRRVLAALDGTGVVGVGVGVGVGVPVSTPPADAARTGRGLPDDPGSREPGTAAVVVEVATGRYDGRAGSVLDAAALSGG